MAINWNYFSKREKGNAINIFRSQFNYTVQQKLSETEKRDLVGSFFDLNQCFSIKKSLVLTNFCCTVVSFLNQFHLIPFYL